VTLRRLFALAVLPLIALPFVLAAPAEKGWKAGVAVQVITPDAPLWMAGYGARKEPAKGKAQDLYVKVLALEDPTGKRLVILTSDLIGISRSLGEAVVAEVQKTEKLPRENFVLTASHTHCGPVIQNNLVDMYPLTDEQRKDIATYSVKLQAWMAETIKKALADLKPAQLAVGHGQAGFAVNRRKPTEKGIINDANPGGPVDHSVPVLRVTSPDGNLRAVLFGYACHNTTLQFYEWCGDYAGFAQAELEMAHPGAVALFWIGCGGDANPLPRGTLDHARKYGKELASAVEKVLEGQLSPVTGGLQTKYATIDLAYDKLPDKEQLGAQTLSKNLAEKNRATRLLGLWEKEGKLPAGYPHYPVQVVRLGDRVLWPILGGEVVVDYSTRLKKELAGGPTVWVTAYANDVMAYIPSERVLKEGGYEADSSMVYYGHPTKWAPGLEDKIVGKVKELAEATRP
jgi:hypothetical protein